MNKLPLEYQIVTKTYLKLTYLPTYAKVVTIVTVVTVMTVVTVGTVVTVVTVVTLVTKILFSPKTGLREVNRYVN